MKRELKERLARLGPIQAIDRVPCGSSADIVIRPEGTLGSVRTIDAIHALIRRGVTAHAAMAAVDAMVEHGEAVIEVPVLESGTAFSDAMQMAGIQVRRIGRSSPADVKAIRESLGLSVAAFAKRYNLNPRTIEGWEQGRPMDDIANTYLHAIAADPVAVARTMETMLD